MTGKHGSGAAAAVRRGVRLFWEKKKFLEWIRRREHRWSGSKPPLEVAGDAHGHGAAALRMIGVLQKSRAPQAARTPDEIMRPCRIENRRKQLVRNASGCASGSNDTWRPANQLIVLGDFNDGPGWTNTKACCGQSQRRDRAGGMDMKPTTFRPPNAQPGRDQSAGGDADARPRFKVRPMAVPSRRCWITIMAERRPAGGPIRAEDHLAPVRRPGLLTRTRRCAGRCCWHRHHFPVALDIRCDFAPAGIAG